MIITFRSKQAGLTLVELMIAMVLGLIIIGGVYGVFISTQQTNRSQEAMSRVQESGRLALEILSRDIRESGQSACAGTDSITNLLDPTSAAYPDFFFDEMNPFAPPPNIATAIANTHVIALNRLASDGRFVVGNPGAGQDGGGGGANVSPQIQVQPEHNIGQCQLILVAGPGGMQCEIFANNVNSNVQVHRGPGNCGNYRNLSPSSVNRELVDYPVGEEIEIFAVNLRSYYIAANANNVRSLFRIDSTTNQAVELVEGIFDMRVEYGIDTTGNGEPNRFVLADAIGANPDWDRFVAIRIHLMAYNGIQDDIVDAPQVLHFAGQALNMPDRRLYQPFSTTIAVRNARAEER